MLVLVKKEGELRVRPIIGSPAESFCNPSKIGLSALPVEFLSIRINVQGLFSTSLTC